MGGQGGGGSQSLSKYPNIDQNLSKDTNTHFFKKGHVQIISKSQKSKICSPNDLVSIQTWIDYRPPIMSLYGRIDYRPSIMSLHGGCIIGLQSCHYMEGFVIGNQSCHYMASIISGAF